LEYSFCLKQYFENFNFKVVLTRKDKNGLYSPFAKNKKKDDMAKREKIIKSTNPDIVVSLHMNSFPSKASNGSQVFYKKESEPSFLLAKSIQKQLVQTVPNARKTPQTGDYFMLNCNSAPSVIVECGFLSNKEEDGLLATKQHKEKICYAIFCGVISFFAS
ncbi:MAG: N-acetylmuramoyl-L-alanine amidase, partial [Clostridia bacterium]